MKKLALHWKILIGMVLGVAVGFAATRIDGGVEFVQDWIKPWGTIFINLLKLLAVPLIIASLIKGISDLSDISKFSRIGIRTMGIYLATTVIAVFIGLLLVNLIQPGNSVDLSIMESINPEAQSAMGRQGYLCRKNQEHGAFTVCCRYSSTKYLWGSFL